MPEVESVKVQRTIFDLDSFKEVKVGKEIPFQAVASAEEALQRLGGSSEKFLGALNDGMRAELRREAAKNPADWRTYDDEGDINGAFTGTVADPKAVNALVLTLAKTIFGYSKDLDKDAKRKTKDSAMDFIKANEQVKEGLKKSAALTVEEE